MEHFGQHLRSLRQKRGFTLKEVAKSIGVHLSFVRNVEIGLKKATTDQVEKFSQLYGVNGRELMNHYYSEKIIEIVTDYSGAEEVIKLALKRLKASQKNKIKIIM